LTFHVPLLIDSKESNMRDADTLPKAGELVPVRYRHDGWTPSRQREFLEALAETGMVAEAARRVGMSESGAYRLRLKKDGGAFDAAWRAALQFGRSRLIATAYERAVNGVVKPVFYRGEKVGEVRSYNDRLLMFAIANPAMAQNNQITPEAERAMEDWEGWLDGIEHGFDVSSIKDWPHDEEAIEVDGREYWSEGERWLTLFRHTDTGESFTDVPYWSTTSQRLRVREASDEELAKIRDAVAAIAQEAEEEEKAAEAAAVEADAAEEEALCLGVPDFSELRDFNYPPIETKSMPIGASGQGEAPPQGAEIRQAGGDPMGASMERHPARDRRPRTGGGRCDVSPDRSTNNPTAPAAAGATTLAGLSKMKNTLRLYAWIWELDRKRARQEKSALVRLGRPG
jgi:hypothetical protein